MTLEQIDEIVEVLSAVHTEMTTDELDEAVIGAAGSWAANQVLPAFGEMWPRWRIALPIAGIRGTLCYGPNRGRKFTYISPHRHLLGFQPMDGHTALNQVVKHYLYAYGPATSQQFAKWLNAPPKWVAKLFSLMADELQEFDVDGDTAWVHNQSLKRRVLCVHLSPE